jgi:hypothetical protein
LTPVKYTSLLVSDEVLLRREREEREERERRERGERERRERGDQWNSTFFEGAFNIEVTTHSVWSNSEIFGWSLFGFELFDK